ncbi:MAG TPA: hypothetical protein VL053_17775 [Arachidicoccus sp.]|nr:hypothetical protein [Arachidicoccus sp.]
MASFSDSPIRSIFSACILFAIKRYAVLVNNAKKVGAKIKGAFNPKISI